MQRSIASAYNDNDNIDVPSIPMVFLVCGNLAHSQHAICQAVLYQDELHML